MRLNVWAMFTWICLSSGVQAQQPRTIVGFWTHPGATCNRGDGALRIGPMDMESEDMTCKFSSVKRSGNTVQWQGVCDHAEGSTRETVTATEVNGRLTIRFHPGGNELTDMKRCKNG